jgi:hypothetical protein
MLEYQCITTSKTECLLHLIDLDEAGMHHLLHKCVLFDEKSKQYKMSGIVDQHDMFALCTILNFSRSTYSLKKEKSIKTKEFYLTVGKESNELSNQYGLATSLDDKNTKKKMHILKILPRRF